MRPARIVTQAATKFSTVGESPGLGTRRRSLYRRRLAPSAKTVFQLADAVEVAAVLVRGATVVERNRLLVVAHRHQHLACVIAVRRPLDVAGESSGDRSAPRIALTGEALALGYLQV